MKYRRQFQSLKPLELLVDSLAVWRLSSLLVKEDGPNYIFRTLREKTGIQYSEWDNNTPVVWPSWNPLTCVYCTSIYAAIIVSFLPNWFRTFWAISAIAIVIEEVNGYLKNTNSPKP